ncbi:MAG: hypothetical protein R3F62_17155 [Planctomycetota bacterium]
MSDRDSRSRERDSLDDPLAALGYAAALEREGADVRTQWEVLLPFREHPGVRERLAALVPAVHSHEGSASWTSSSCPPLRRPRERWRVRHDPSDERSGFVLVASPLGLVCSAGEGGAFLLLDPEDGSLRGSFDASVPFDHPGSSPQVVGTTLLCWSPPTLTVRDLWTRRELSRARLPGIAQVRVFGDRLVAWSEDLVRVYAFEAPLGAPLWERSAGLLTFLTGPNSAHVGDDCLLLAAVGSRTGSFRLRDGARVDCPADGQVLHADSVGVLARPPEGGISSRPGVSARETWTRRTLGLLAASPTCLLAWRDAPEGAGIVQVVRVARGTGEVEEVLYERVFDFGASAFAQDTLYTFMWLGGAAWSDLANSELTAHAPTGEVLWSWLPGVLDPACALCPQPGPRLYVLLQSGTVVCLEEAEGEDSA